MKFGVRVRTWDFLFYAKFCKSRLRKWQIIPKITKFCVRVRTLDSSPMSNFVKKNRLRGSYSYGQIFTTKFHILTILADLSPHF